MRQVLVQKRRTTSALLFLALCSNALPASTQGVPASQFDQIDRKSSYVILGNVTSVESGAAGSGNGLLVEVVSFLRGLPSTDRVSVSPEPFGARLSDFDPKPGDLVVLYLKALDGTEGKLTRPDSLFPIITKDKPYYAYVARMTENSVILAWGKPAAAVNSIGLDSRPLGKAKIRLGEQVYSESARNWIEISGLEPDRSYDYAVMLNGLTIGTGRVRTYPEESRRLAFFVIGDWGYSSYGQLRLAEAMARLYRKKAGSDNPIRFVITTGDNIYKDKRSPRGQTAAFPDSGDSDHHWEHKFYWPYRALIRHIPFYPSLGNHDGDESENSRDLEAYLDNFHLSERYYRFRFARLAEFYALDSTRNSSPKKGEIYSRGGAQHRWLNESLEAASREGVAWKIPYFHHPPYNAGPRGKPSERLRYLEPLLEHSGVRVVFNGHEHNFQFSQPAAPKSRIRFVVTGGAGKPASDADLRSRPDFKGRNIDGAMMKEKAIAYWTDQFHFLHVEISGETMEVRVQGMDGRIDVRDVDGRQISELPRIELAGRTAALPGR